MPNFAQVTLIGHLGKSPETKTLPGGDTVTSFALATNRRRKDGDLSTWWNCSMWGKRGETIRQYLSKGDPILVVGEAYQRPYTTKDGREGVALEVEVRDWSFVGGKGDQNAAGGHQGASRDSGMSQERGDARDAHRASQAAQAPSGGGPADYDDDIPF